MTVTEAKDILLTAIADETPSKANPALTRADFVKIMVDGMDSLESKHGADHVIGDLFEKRIHQCVKNQRRPRY